MPGTAELTDADKGIIAEVLRALIAADRFPLSPRVKSWQAILDKLDSAPPRETLPPPKPAGEPSWAKRKRRQ